MKKCLNKITCISLILFMILGICSNVFAADVKTSLDVIQKESETKYLDKDQGNISKTIVESNSDTGEVTIELKLSNTAKKQEKSAETEIFLVVDNSGSMGYSTSTGETRREIIIRAIKSLVNSIYNNSSKVKVGLVRFAYRGELLNNSSALMCNLTDSKQEMLNAIKEYENLDTSVNIDGKEMKHCESGTNIEAGLKKAEDNFSSEKNNKILILLTDGIPNSSLYYLSESYIYKATKERLKNIGDSGVSIISMMTGITEDEDGEKAQETIKNIFGTETKPTTGKFYNIADTNIEKVVSKDILSDVMEKVQNPINTVKIVDYFPKDITENFEFSYVGKPNLGTISDKINSKDNTIEWNIETLKGSETATLRYKLKIKDMKDTKLLNKTIATNEKVELSYNDTEAKAYKVILLSSPKILLSQIKEENTNKVNTTKTNTEANNIDTTTAKGSLPQTGSVTIIFVVLVIILISIVAYKKYDSFKDVK